MAHSWGSRSLALALLAVVIGGCGGTDSQQSNVVCAAVREASVIITVVDSSGGPVSGVTLANLSPADMPQLSYVCVPPPHPPLTGTSVCIIWGDAPGTYQADVLAPGYVTQHVRVDVPTVTEPCRKWDAQSITVTLVPG
jgi:hypothetical protein